MVSLRSIRGAGAGAMGAGALAGALLFGGTPVALAAPAPIPDTSFATAGPHGAPGIIPDRPGGRGWGHGNPGWAHRGFWGPGHWWNWWW